MCDGCMKPVNVTLMKSGKYLGRGWRYTCPACEWHREEHGLNGKHDDPPTAMDILRLLAPVLQRIADDESATLEACEACRLAVAACRS